MLLLGLAAEWLLPGGIRASFPLADPLLDRGLVGWGLFFRRGVGRGMGGKEVGEVLIRPVGLPGVKQGGWAGFAGLSDAGGLAPSTGPGAVEDQGGGQGGCEDAEGEDLTCWRGWPSPRAGSRPLPLKGGGRPSGCGRGA